MSKPFVPKAGTTAECAAFTGLKNEVVLDEEKGSLIVHDGVTVGGAHEILPKEKNDVLYAPKNIDVGVTSVNGNKGDLTSEQTGCLPLSGGTMTGAVTFTVPAVINQATATSYTTIRGGTTNSDGARLVLTSKGDSDKGLFRVYAHDGTNSPYLMGTPDGILKWNNKDVVRSVNGKAADGDGNVPFSIGGWTESIDGVDLNTVKKAGVYYVTNSSASLNCPSGSNGVLIVYANVESDTSPVGTCRQVFYRVGTINSNDYNIFTRQLHADGTAGEWIRDVYLIDSYKSGASWYRKYSDGWIEQGGNVEAPNSGWTAIPLHIPFSKKDYNLMTCNSGATTDAFATKVENSGKNTTTTAYACVYHSNGTGIRWEAKGY